ncbi:MAG: BPL-N domain-containing protein [Micavibrio sp.]
MAIRVYTGTGTSRNGAPLLIEELSKHLTIPVAGIDEHEMRGSRAWETKTTTLIFAGQSVGQFKAALGKDVMERIRQALHAGAFDYAGICAGVALALSRIKYRMKPTAPHGPPIKIENTGLALFNGLASGPCRSVSPLPFSGGPENLSLIRLRSPQDYQAYNAFFWGGPAIIPTESLAPHDGRILAFLESDGTPLAVRSKFGQGRVSLFSFHPEINAGNIGRWAEARFLSEGEALRLERLAGQLDGTAFTRFLNDAGLTPHIAPKKEAAPAATHYNFDLL